MDVICFSSFRASSVTRLLPGRMLLTASATSDRREGEQARIHVEGDGRGRIPQLPLQCLDVRARGDAHARVRVAQAVDRDAFAGEPAGAECRIPRPRPPVSRSSLSSPSCVRRGWAGTAGTSIACRAHTGLSAIPSGPWRAWGHAPA